MNRLQATILLLTVRFTDQPHCLGLDECGPIQTILDEMDANQYDYGEAHSPSAGTSKPKNQAKLANLKASINGIDNEATDSHKHINGLMSNGDHNGLHPLNGDFQMNGNNSTQHANDAAVEAILEQSEKAPPPIVIVGMGMRLPGGVNDECAFWDLLVKKRVTVV